MSPLPRPHRSQLAAALLCAGALSLLGACSQPPAAEVIAADGALCDITRRLAAADTPVQCLLGPNDDPHQFQLTPSQSRNLRQARLVLINGYGLTPALERQRRAIAIAEQAVPDSPRLDATAEPEPVHSAEEAHDHDHPQVAEDHATERHGQQHGDRDPHVWHDPTQAAAMVAAVSQQLQQLHPAAAPAIARRAGAMTQTLSALDRWNRRQFASLPALPGHRTLATGHRAFASLSRAYGLRELAVVDAHSAGDSLRPQALAAALRRLRQDGVAALFSETWPASRALQRISDLSGVPLAPQALRADGLTDGDLLTTLTGNTCLIVDQLGGRCDHRGEQALISQWQAIR